MLNNEFQKKFDNEEDALAKNAIKRDYSEFMVKLDSIQNTAFIATLIKVKNREDLENIALRNLPKPTVSNSSANDVEQNAEYPGGINALRSQFSHLFYLNNAANAAKILKAEVIFIVGKDGSIGNVHAEGDNFIFNRQAEIAAYLLPDKFSPALSNGIATRYKLRFPITMTFD